MSDSVATILPQGAGYGVVVGIGFFFALLMAGVAWMQNRYTAYSTHVSEEFNTASRNVKPGLIASGVVSAWTWAATLLQSCTVAYEYGISGPFWVNAAGATVQIFMFSVLACKLKQNAPRCHTFLEIVYARYGAGTHIVFTCFALVTNLLVGSQLLLGGSAVVTSLTGMNVYAAVWLIPLGVAVYVVLGGLRATFLCDFSHTIILMVIILYFMFNVYTTNDLIGSPGAMYDLLVQAAKDRPVPGNQDGSYLTLKSNSGLIFGVIQLCSGLGTVFLDQGYWQRAIASRPSTAVPAYILGGMAWFAIPFGFATTLGLTAAALAQVAPAFPTYPAGMTSSQIQAGLAAPFAAQTLAGQSGAIALLITLFMAVTSSSSAELIAVASILTFDLYKTYYLPWSRRRQPAGGAPVDDGDHLVAVSHVMIVIFAIIMAIFASLWNAVGIDLGWLFLTMGLIIGGAVFPAAFSVTWPGQTRAGAVCGCLCGLAAGLTAWLVEAHVLYGELTISSTGQLYPTLAGNMASVLTGMIVSIVVSYATGGPWNEFDWAVTRAINAPVVVEGTPEEASTRGDVSGDDKIVALDDSGREEKGETDEKKIVVDEAGPQHHNTSSSSSSAAAAPVVSDARHLVGDNNNNNNNNNNNGGDREEARTVTQLEEKEMAEDARFLEDPRSLRRAFMLALVTTIVLTLIMDIVVPIPMFLSHYVFSEQFFYAWIVISFIWVFAALAICGILPVWETRGFWKMLVGEMFAVGKKRRGDL